MPDDKKIIDPIDAEFDDVAKAMVSRPTQISNYTNQLAQKGTDLVPPPAQVIESFSGKRLEGPKD